MALCCHGHCSPRACVAPHGSSPSALLRSNKQLRRKDSVAWCNERCNCRRNLCVLEYIKNMNTQIKCSMFWYGWCSIIPILLIIIQNVVAIQSNLHSTTWTIQAAASQQTRMPTPFQTAFDFVPSPSDCAQTVWRSTRWQGPPILFC